MSVLIKDMEMPTSCHACCFFGQADVWESDFDGYTKSFCKRTGSQTYDYVDKFFPNCPLVPVPPHGRLIDADVLTRAQGIHDYKYENGLVYVGVGEIVSLIKASPTVIPAEPPKEES